ncbi:WXG100 family type VII secretion target [Actinokineospora pegani]|uniref:WXG100 family type VII secretion target n=1 Tax=Actinokineospora pegani TaxID=2654637 RepID=UPI0012EACC40|nr:hypothetical protein [Actinokineospora pegani]
MVSTESSPWVNWEAYTHEELYRMLWEGADVADVSTVAAEWGRHRDALTTHAQALREQRTALLGDWRGRATEEAVARLAALAERVDKLAEFAHAGHRAAQDAADGLATARAMMPPPAPDFTRGWTDFASAFSRPAYSEVGTAFGAVAGGGFSFYLGSVAGDQQKAQAIHAMEVYESNLVGGSRLIGEARGAIPAATPATTTPAMAAPAATAPAAATPTGAEPDARVRWERPASGGPPSVAGVGHGGGEVGGGPGAPARQPVPGPAPGLGARFGVVPGAPGHAALAAPAAEPAAARTTAQGGMVSPGAGRGSGTEEERHENRMPALDQKLFVVDEATSVPVIGADQ